MNDLLEILEEAIGGIRAEQEKLKDKPSPYLAVAHGGLSSAIDNLRHEIERREKAQSK